MGNYKEDTNQDLRTIFFIIIFSLFVLSSSNIQGNHYPFSTKFTTQTELVFGSKSSHHNAIICNAFRLPDFQKYCDSTPLNTSLNPFSTQNKILDYNRRIAQNFIQIQKTRLSLEPILTSRLYFHLPSNKDDDLPVLS
jgi:hypothetical protein